MTDVSEEIPLVNDTESNNNIVWIDDGNNNNNNDDNSEYDDVNNDETENLTSKSSNLGRHSTMRSTPRSSSCSLSLTAILFVGVIIGIVVNELLSRGSITLKKKAEIIHEMEVDISDLDESSSSSQLVMASNSSSSVENGNSNSNSGQSSTPEKKEQQQQVNNSKPYPLPSLSSLVDARTITNDVSWLLDFAIVGFPKCATTYLLHYLGKYSIDTFMLNKELCQLSKNRPDRIVRRYYKHAADADRDGSIQLGLKCPEDLETEFALNYYKTYFPKTKLIISVRHPVLFFESFYNYRAYNEYPHGRRMPHPNELIGPCEDGDYPYVPYYCGVDCPSGNMNVCTDRAKFHYALSRLGKTPLSTAKERTLLQHNNMTVLSSSPNKVFLLEKRQLRAEDEVASGSLPRDLQQFLGLTHELRPLKSNYTHAEREDEEAKKLMIDICDDDYTHLRAVLLDIGRDAATWITQYFLKSPDVIVSSRSAFIELLDDWGRDPCDDDRMRYF